MSGFHISIRQITLAGGARDPILPLLVEGGGVLCFNWFSGSLSSMPEKATLLPSLMGLGKFVHAGIQHIH